MKFYYKWFLAKVHCWFHCLIYFHREFTLNDGKHLLSKTIACWECEKVFLGFSPKTENIIKALKGIDMPNTNNPSPSNVDGEGKGRK